MRCISKEGIPGNDKVNLTKFRLAFKVEQIAPQVQDPLEVVNLGIEEELRQVWVSR